MTHDKIFHNIFVNVFCIVFLVFIFFIIVSRKSKLHFWFVLYVPTYLHSPYGYKIIFLHTILGVIIAVTISCSYRSVTEKPI